MSPLHVVLVCYLPEECGQALTLLLLLIWPDFAVLTNTVCIKAQVNFICVFADMRKGKYRPIRVLWCSCMLMNICAYLSLLHYIVPQSSTVCVFFYDNISSLIAQHFASLIETALNDTHLFEEKSGVCRVWTHLEEILSYLLDNLKLNADKYLSQRKVGRKDWNKWLHSPPVFWKLWSVVTMHFFTWYLKFRFFPTVTIIMLLILILSINLYKSNLALIIIES